MPSPSKAPFALLVATLALTISIATASAYPTKSLKRRAPLAPGLFGGGGGSSPFGSGENPFTNGENPFANGENPFTSGENPFAGVLGGGDSSSDGSDNPFTGGEMGGAHEPSFGGFGNPFAGKHGDGDGPSFGHFGHGHGHGRHPGRSLDDDAPSLGDLMGNNDQINVLNGQSADVDGGKTEVNSLMDQFGVLPFFGDDALSENTDGNSDAEKESKNQQTSSTEPGKLSKRRL